MIKIKYLILSIFPLSVIAMQNLDEVYCYNFGKRSIQYKGVVNSLIVRAARIDSNYFCIETSIKNGVMQQQEVENSSQAHLYWFLLHTRYFNQQVKRIKKIRDEGLSDY